MSSVMFPCGGSWSILDLLRKEERPLLHFAPKSLFRRGIRESWERRIFFRDRPRQPIIPEMTCGEQERVVLLPYRSGVRILLLQHLGRQPPDNKKGPTGSGAFFIQSEAGASRRLSTCRPCRPCHPCRQAWQERPSWVRAFRRWRIRWSAAGRPRKRRSAGRYGSPSWGR